MRWRDKASERVSKASTQTTEWLNREQQGHPELAELAIQLYERDRDSFASVLGSALALRLFLFVITANVAFVGLIALLHLGGVVGDAFASSVTTGTMAETYLDADFWRALVLSVSGTIGTLWAGRTLTRSMAVCSAAAWQLPIAAVKVRVKSVLLVTGLFAFLTLSATMFSWMRDVGGIVVGLGVWAAVFATAALGTFAFMYTMPRRGTDPGVLLPGVALVAAGFTLLQWFMQLYLPGRIERTEDTLGDMAIAVAALGYFFYFGRLISSAFVVNATLHDRYGSLSGFVFGLPVLRRTPNRWPRIRTFFELTSPAEQPQPPQEGDVQ